MFVKMLFFCKHLQELRGNSKNCIVNLIKVSTQIFEKTLGLIIYLIANGAFKTPCLPMLLRCSLLCNQVMEGRVETNIVYYFRSQKGGSKPLFPLKVRWKRERDPSRWNRNESNIWLLRVATTMHQESRVERREYTGNPPLKTLV